MSGKEFLVLLAWVTLPWLVEAFLVDFFIYQVDEVANRDPTHPYYMYVRVVMTPAWWVWASYTIVLCFGTPRLWMWVPVLALAPPLFLFFGGGYVWLGWAGGHIQEFAELSKLSWLLSHIPGAERAWEWLTGWNIWEWMFPAEYGCRNTPTCGP